MATMSFSPPLARRNLVAMPRMPPTEGSVSAASGLPPALEKRMVSGVGGPARKAAELSVSAPGAGVNMPSNTAPVAWLARTCGCAP
jgi:hypothetical protein